jgi:cell division protein FtsB
MSILVVLILAAIVGVSVGLMALQVRQERALQVEAIRARAAAELEKLRDENAALRARVEELESRLKLNGDRREPAPPASTAP